MVDALSRPLISIPWATISRLLQQFLAGSTLLYYERLSQVDG